MDAMIRQSVLIARPKHGRYIATLAKFDICAQMPKITICSFSIAPMRYCC